MIMYSIENSGIIDIGKYPVIMSTPAPTNEGGIYRSLKVQHARDREAGFKVPDGDKCICVKMNNGSFNWCFKVVFDDGTEWAVRFPVAGNVMPEEKVRREVAVVRFIKEKTLIPVPAVIAFGMAADNHDLEMGPFIIEEWIDGVPLSTIMEELPRPSWRPVLRKDISDDILYTIYRQIAKILLEPSMHNFDKIGALSLAEHKDSTTSWQITSAPMTQKMNEIERGGYVRVDGKTSVKYNLENIMHLRKQRNYIDDIDGARRKYSLHQRVKSLVPYFVSKNYDFGPFKLICDDFRPESLLVKEDTLEIVAVVDWEWTYAGPYQFLFSPPSWLILENPTSWISSSEARYQTKFLKNRLAEISIPNKTEIETFVRMKIEELSQYKLDLQALKGKKEKLKQKGLLEGAKSDDGVPALKHEDEFTSI
ncbi:hypothetical protein B7494_g6612 [Chlorociboria aeruginascens]|nr:hypothetical protein B7494_g6612 [Chlorociboria aeruginascens]